MSFVRIRAEVVYVTNVFGQDHRQDGHHNEATKDPPLELLQNNAYSITRTPRNLRRETRKRNVPLLSI